jgi:hypothetical protein
MKQGNLLISFSPEAVPPNPRRPRTHATEKPHWHSLSLRTGLTLDPPSPGPSLFFLYNPRGNTQASPIIQQHSLSLRFPAARCLYVRVRTMFSSVAAASYAASLLTADLISNLKYTLPLDPNAKWRGFYYISPFSCPGCTAVTGIRYGA